MPGLLAARRDRPARPALPGRGERGREDPPGARPRPEDPGRGRPAHGRITCPARPSRRVQHLDRTRRQKVCSWPPNVGRHGRRAGALYQHRVPDERVAVGHEVRGGERQPRAPVGGRCFQAEAGEGRLEGRIARRERIALSEPERDVGAHLGYLVAGGECRYRARFGLAEPDRCEAAAVTIAGSGNVWVRPSGRPGTGVPSAATKASSRLLQSGWPDRIAETPTSNGFHAPGTARPGRLATRGPSTGSPLSAATPAE